MTKAILAAFLCASATTAIASGPGETHVGDTNYLENGSLTYEVFETALPHVDLDGCPAQFDTDVVFCRMTLANEMAHVFVFSYEGDQPLLAVKSYGLGDGFLPF